MKQKTFARPTVLIFMGVAGSGKTTIAKLFAKRTGVAFIEGDDFHPARNIAKMAAGIPLTDADRECWLKALRRIIVRALVKGGCVALTCSALKAKYRRTLAANDPRVKFVYLKGSRTLITRRLKNRRGHFMHPDLLVSQFLIIEPPADALVFSCRQTPAQIVSGVMKEMALKSECDRPRSLQSTQ